MKFHPLLYVEYDQESNVLPLEKFSIASEKKVWWKCVNGTEEVPHKWLTQISVRSRGFGCPFCGGKRFLKGFNDLKTKNPELLSDWDYKNNTVLPEEISYTSSVKVWWICVKEHSYEMKIHNKNSGKQSCPYCSNKKVWRGFNDLGSNFPELEKEWHYKRNSHLLDPYQINIFSHKKVWWICDKDHEWETEIRQRTGMYKTSTGCPFCAGKKVMVGFNDLATTHPALSKEFVSSQSNENVYEITAGSNKNVLWKCLKCLHFFNASPCDRTRKGRKKTGCPRCSKKNSKIEKTFRDELAGFFILENKYEPTKIKINGKKLTIDIVAISGKNTIAIEYDGSYWHRNKQEFDIEKTKQLLEKGYHVVRIREIARNNGTILSFEHPNLLQVEFEFYDGSVKETTETIKDWIERR